MGKINQTQRAAIGWTVLTTVSQKQEFIRYNELARQIGIHHRPLRYVLGLIQNYCLINHLPPLTILVVNQTGLPGEGFIAWDVDNIEEGLSQVYNYNWQNLENPFGYAEKGFTEEEVINSLLNDPDSSNEIYSLIKVRGAAQPIFRKALLLAYENKCAFCDFTFPVALQASHIVAWSKASKNERLDIRNGILLCSTHHKLFDCGLFTINDDYLINYFDVEKEAGIYSHADEYLTLKIHNKKIRLPRNRKHWPRKDFLKRHRDAFA